jgi:ABC-type multidrug transport system ATPase subunit
LVLDEVERLCSRIGILKGGRKAREGTVEELVALEPGRAVALIEILDEAVVEGRACSLGWAVILAGETSLAFALVGEASESDREFALS